MGGPNQPPPHPLETAEGATLDRVKYKGKFAIYTVATCHWDPSLSKWGPNGDPIFSEMGTKWGPSAAEWGPKKQMFAKLSETR